MTLLTSVFTTMTSDGAGEQITKSSWFPPPQSWEGSSYDSIEWMPNVEEIEPVKVKCYEKDSPAIIGTIMESIIVGESTIIVNRRESAKRLRRRFSRRFSCDSDSRRWHYKA